MRISVWAAALCVCLLSRAAFAQESAITFTARCDGGTVALAHESVVVQITPDELVLTQGRKRISVPVSHVTFVAYSDPDDVTQLAGIQWTDPADNIVLRLPKQDYNKVVAALKSMYERARTTKQASGTAVH